VLFFPKTIKFNKVTCLNLIEKSNVVHLVSGFHLYGKKEDTYFGLCCACLSCLELLLIIIYMQRWLWWKEKCVRGVVKRGQGFVGTQKTATGSAGTGRVHNMELVMPDSQDLLASVA
jgi:hypothetical protein